MFRNTPDFLKSTRWRATESYDHDTIQRLADLPSGSRVPEVRKISELVGGPVFKKSTPQHLVEAREKCVIFPL